MLIALTHLLSVVVGALCATSYAAKPPCALLRALEDLRYSGGGNRLGPALAKTRDHRVVWTLVSCGGY
jgi:hypothetical protein